MGVLWEAVGVLVMAVVVVAALLVSHLFVYDAGRRRQGRANVRAAVDQARDEVGAETVRLPGQRGKSS